MTLEAEDAKLVTLARATRTRANAEQGAAIRDQDGRTYAAASVELPSLRLSAVGGAIAMAVASGAKSLEAVVVLGGDGVSEGDLAVVRDFTGAQIPIHIADERGSVTASLVS